MNSATRMIRTVCFVLLLGSVACFAAKAQAAREAEKMEDIREEAAKAKREAAQEAKRKALEKAKAKLEEHIADIALLEDTTQRFTVRELSISGNALISTDKLLKNMPLIYNASDKPLRQAESSYLYDLRVLHDITLYPVSILISRSGSPGIRKSNSRLYPVHSVRLPGQGLRRHICVCAKGCDQGWCRAT